ncbi:FLII actin remodeling protein isoform X2 [Cotesia typhae]|uniref:FLII actin remodeling protein isoform X2 n=1 Tax=Cotesia typhae TaxID=2053667 RepID=UPI003D6868A3
MANTGVLPFVRGVDFSDNDFSTKFPASVRLMTGTQWLKLNRTNLSQIPEELGKLQKLEHLSLVKNNLERLYGELTDLGCLRSLNIRHNSLKTSGIPCELFNLEELTTLDLGYNNLKEVPEGLEKARSLLNLNLSHNQIEIIPNSLFINLTDLLFLDLSYNRLETLPPQTRRLSNLQTLNLNHNPLGHFQLRQLPSLMNLTTLQMCDTQRTLNNIPSSLESLTNLQELDLSQNSLPRVPDALYLLSNLKRLNLSDNEITEMSSAAEMWQKLEILNLCRNKLSALPASICRISNLRCLYLNDNHLEFEGIPPGIGKLSSLQIFSAAKNHLKMIPEGLCRCRSLKKLILSSNRLITVPDAIHLLSDLDQLDLRDNPNLIMPPKPTEIEKGSGIEFYNIDFSLQHQLRLAGANVPPPIQISGSKDPTARRLRLRKRRDQEEADQDQAKILKGMKDVASTKNKERDLSDYKTESLKPKRWDESLEKPSLDYSEIFDEDAGQVPGLSVWEIENFLPNQIEEVAHGKFYEGDCYIILKTTLDESGSLMWSIFFWIGEKATLDKRACAAIHAVNLRNFLGAQCRTIREEQGDESDDFLLLFNSDITYIEGGRTSSGFYTVDDTPVISRLYRVLLTGASIHLEPVLINPDSLNSNFVFIFDTYRKIYLWYGKNAKNTLKSKSRLMAEKINKNEKRFQAEIVIEIMGMESNEFCSCLGVDKSNLVIKNHDEADFKISIPRLYQVRLGMGYLELPQVEVSRSKLTPDHLNSKNVYIVDCYSDVFVWFGKKSTRLVKAAAVKLSQELFNMIDRPEFALVMRLQEGSECQIFKSKFIGWDEVIAVDFTRTAESVAKTGADLSTWAKQQDTKADLTALFMPRQPQMSSTEAQQLMNEWSDDLEVMEAFVLEKRKFVRLPEEELGHFFTEDCYVFLCRYWMPLEMADNDDGKHVEDDFQCIVYFWQGRDAGNMGWLTFTFSMQKKFKTLFGEKLEVVRTHQQQENLKFMAHFKKRFVIHQGKRNQLKVQSSNRVEFFHLRSNGSALCTRLIQVEPDASLLNSAFCYILNVPFTNDDKTGIVYVWIGSKSDSEEAHLIEEIAREMFKNPWISLQVLSEGEEPDNFFWVALGGKKSYDTDDDYMRYTRLFRCSNEKGYFMISEKCSDFCQDDLADDDIMILDNGEQVFLWLGAHCSEVEIKLAYKSAQVYIQHLRVTQPEKPRKLFLTAKGKESRRFTKCFHGWSSYKKSLL